MSVLSTKESRKPRLSSLERSDLEALLEIAEAATSHLDLEDLLRVVVDKVAQVVPVDRCSVILVEGSEDEAIVIASHDVPDLRRLPIQIARYPEIRKALDSKSAVVVEDVWTDPLMTKVRPLLAQKPVASLVVAPLVSQGDAVGALFLRLARSTAFGPHEQAFVRAVASTVAGSVRNARLHSSVRQKRDELQAAYQERYEELNRLNEQLREASRIKDELLAVCSHDLRAPLNVLLGHTRLLQRRVEGTPSHSSVTVIERQARRILQLVERILVRSRGKNAWILSLEPLDLSSCIKESVSDFDALAAEKGVSLVVSGEEAARVQADESAVRQIIENLVSNAVVHTKEGTEVEVRILAHATSSDWLRIEVLDRGEGIPEDELPLVFERYRHGDKGEGVGLGLAICKELVELHGGDIWASQRRGGGTVISFTLPVRPPGAAGSKRLLLVEDDPAIREELALQLGSDYSISFAGSRREGVARAKALLPDVVIVGAGLGAPCAEEIRKQPGLGATPCILYGVEGEIAEGEDSTRAVPDLDGLLAALAHLAGGSDHP